MKDLTFYDRRFSTLFAQHGELATAFGELLAQLNESAGEQ
jgi:hypothetical protein